MKERNNYMLAILLFLTIFVTIFSQSKIIFDNGFTPLLQYSWIILCLFCFNIKVLKKIYIPIILFGVIYLYCVFSTTTLNNYLDILIIPRLPLLLLLLFSGALVAEKVKEVNFEKIIFLSTLLGGILLLISFLFFDSGTEVDDYTLNIALGSRKNSVAILILTCVYVSYKLGPINKKYFQIVLACFAMAGIYTMVSMKCRTAFFSIPFLLFVEPIFTGEYKAVKRIIPIALGGFLILYFIFPNFFSYLGNEFLYDDVSSRQMNSMDARGEMFAIFFKTIKNNFFFGTGYLFIENFYVINLLNLGLIGFIPLLLFLFWSYKKCFNQYRGKIFMLNRMLFFLYFFNGCFEGESPFGPGSRCFLLWFILGYTLNFKNRRYVENNSSPRGQTTLFPYGRGSVSERLSF